MRLPNWKPDFFVNSGDTIYADNPFASELKLDDGTIWKNIVTEETSKVAETLGEFRANYRYNLMDENVRRMNSLVPLMVQWDDHEVLNNWYPTEQLADDRYKVKSVSLLAARARQAFMDYLPIRASADGMAASIATSVMDHCWKYSSWISAAIALRIRRIDSRKRGPIQPLWAIRKSTGSRRSSSKAALLGKSSAAICPSAWS